MDMDILRRVAAEKVSFEFSDFTSPRNIKLVGDSFLKDGGVHLTLLNLAPTPSSGAFIYDSPVSLFDPTTNTSCSFSTSFSFDITNLDPFEFGEGIAFFLSPANLSLPSSSAVGGRLGLPTSSPFVAVTFNVRQDEIATVGFNVNSLNSIASVDPITHGIDLKSGEPITSWIDYDSERSLLTVFLSYSSSSKPLKPVLTVCDVDLSKHFKDMVYVGFSASAEMGFQMHLIGSWSFRSFGFCPKEIVAATCSEF